MGVIEAEGCHRVPGVVPLGEHAEVCQCCEELGNICNCTPNGTTNVTVELQWNDASPTSQAYISGDLLNAEQSCDTVCSAQLHLEVFVHSIILTLLAIHQERNLVKSISSATSVAVVVLLVHTAASLTKGCQIFLLPGHGPLG